jgi:hypothetical protein
MYEVEQLHGLVERLLQIRKHDDAHGDRDLDYLDMATRNAQVESFAMHTRALIDFLYHPRKKPTDAVATDYTPPGWRPPEKLSSLKIVNTRVGTEIAHLSYKRVGITDEERQWPYLRVWLDLSPALQSFAEAASPDLLPAEVASRILELTKPFRHDKVFELQSLALSATNFMPDGERP